MRAGSTAGGPESNAPAGVALAASALLLFVVWTTVTARTELVTYHGKYAIFARHYEAYGLAGTRLLPFYNFELTDPPTGAYVSHPPLVPLLMYGAARLFGDRPATYQGVMVALHVVAFALLAWLAARRWGFSTGWWTVVLAALSPYALRYGDQQTPELLGVVGSFVAILLYFEWLTNGRRPLLLLAVAAYVVGVASDYCVALAGIAIAAHWAWMGTGTPARRDWRLMLLWPAATITVVGVMAALMLAADVAPASVLDRAAARSTLRVSPASLPAIAGTTAWLVGLPCAIVAALTIAALAVGRRRRGPRGPDDGRDLELLAVLAAPGVLFVVLFAQAYIVHPFLVVHLLPFFTIAAAIGIARATSMWTARRQLAASVAVVAVTAWSAFHGNPRLHGPTADDEEAPYRRLAALARVVRPELRDGDRLLILDGARHSSLTKVTVFQALWIPTTEGGAPDTWDTTLDAGRHRLVLTTDATARDRMRRRRGNRTIAEDDPFAFFDRTSASPAASDVDR